MRRMYNLTVSQLHGSYALDVSSDDLLTNNLKHSSSPVNTELHDMLLDCNDDEKDILIKLVKYAKGLLVEHGI